MLQFVASRGCAMWHRSLTLLKTTRPGIMRHEMILNSKGGCGKSTLATNIAVFFAREGRQVCIADYDPQRSSLDWLAQRAADMPAISGVAAFEHRHKSLRTIHGGTARNRQGVTKAGAAGRGRQSRARIHVDLRRVGSVPDQTQGTLPGLLERGAEFRACLRARHGRAGTA